MVLLLFLALAFQVNADCNAFPPEVGSNGLDGSICTLPITNGSSCQLACENGYILTDGDLILPCVGNAFGNYTGYCDLDACTWWNDCDIVGDISGKTHCTDIKQGPNSTLGRQCVCRSGYTDSGGNCIECGIGSYKPDPGNQACTSCAANGTTLLTGLTEPLCLCQAGFEGDGLINCTGCPGGTYNPSIGGNCIACDGNATSLPASTTSTSCRCNQGFEGPGISCSACAVDMYKDGLDAGPCLSCALQASTLGVTAGNSSTCQCLPGYSGNGITSCTACAAGSFKAIAGSASCTACSTVRPLSTTVSIATNASDGCLCNVGYNWTGTACQACPLGTYKSTISQGPLSGPGLCISCGGNATTLSAGSTSDSSCLCNIGFTGDGITCASCPPGTSKTVVGNGPCTTCDPNAISVSGSGCACNAGYSGTGTVCVACATGRYKTSVGAGSCFDCPLQYNIVDWCCFESQLSLRGGLHWYW